MKVLCTGDLHIGRRPSRLPSHVDSRPLSCAAIWSTIVDYAVAQQVDAVLLSGDIVDTENRYFEALGPLERGLRRLSDHGITTVAVAGNHDFDVLPELTRVLPSETFRVLGRGGVWEATRVHSRDGASLDVHGWSFPARHIRDCPLDSYRLTPDGDTPVIGLLHADLDQPHSPYAPVASSALRLQQVAAWVLGHVHAPASHTIPGAPPILYPGSPQAMDPGASGAHGVWMLDVQPGAAVQPRLVPLASVRYEVLDVDVTGVRDLEDLRPAVLERVRSAVADFARESDTLCCLVLQLRISGETLFHRQVRHVLSGMTDDWDGGDGGVAVVVDRIDVATRAPHDLVALANGADAIAVLAQVIQACTDQETTAEHHALIQGAEQVAVKVRQAKSYEAIAHIDEGLDASAIRGVLRTAANDLLDELLAQRALS